MTVVAAYAGVWGGLIAADSRITAGSLNHRAYRDVCQKIVRLGTGDCWIGFAGDIYTARKFLYFAYNYTSENGSAWLNSQDDILALLSGANVTPDDNVAHFLALYREGEPRQGFPVRRCHTVAFDSQKTMYRNTHLGFDAIGSGSSHADRATASMESTELANMINTVAIETVSVWFADKIYQQLGRGQEPTVGGLFQLHYIKQNSIGVVPYEKWIRLGTGIGTYVKMVVKDDRWVQIHEPTNLQVPLGFPLDENFDLGDLRKNKVFDLKYLLDPNGPGIIREPQVVTEYRYVGGETKSIAIPLQFRKRTSDH